MQIRKTWFSYLALFLFLFGTLYILICGIASAGEGQEYPFLVKGMLMLILAGTLVGSHFAAVVGARMELESWADRSPVVWKAVEAAAVCLILAVSFALRVWVVKAMPMTPQSDYKTYYEIAQMLNRGTLLEEGKGYCDYVAIFPHVLGYSAVLAALFRIFGESVFVGQMFNITLAVATCLICWHITRMLTGRIAAIIALAMIAFWPSMILYNNFLAAEYLFSFLLFLCVWLMVILVTRFTPDSPEQWKGIVLHALLGILLACTSAIRPMALLLLISICICLAPSRMDGPILPRNDIPVSNRFMQRGWVRALVVLLCYLVVSAFITKCVAFTVDRDLASGSASMGYNLLVGLNEEAYGGWNPDDAAYLYDVLDSTGSAEQAQIACRDLAFQRLGGGFRMLSNLFMRKYTVLWGNDDYGISWNIILLDEMGTLTKELESMLYSLQDFNNIWYLVVVFFAGLGGIYLIKGRGSWSYLLVLLFCGTVAMHLLVENQNRYHFHCLYVFAILAAQGLHLMYQDSKYRIVIGNANRQRMEQEQEEEKVALKRINEAEAFAQATQDKAMGVLFDMEQALKTGHVKVSVSQAYSSQSKEFLKQIGVEGLDDTAEETSAEPVSETAEAAKASEITAEAAEAAEPAAEASEPVREDETVTEAAVPEAETAAEVAAAVSETETTAEITAVSEDDTAAEAAPISEDETTAETAPVTETEIGNEVVAVSETGTVTEVAAVSETGTEEAAATEPEGTSETAQVSEAEDASQIARIIIPAAPAEKEQQAVAEIPAALSTETSGEPEAETLAARLDSIQGKTKSGDVAPNLSIIDFSKKTSPAQPQLTLLDLPKPPVADVPIAPQTDIPRVPLLKLPRKPVLEMPVVPAQEKAPQPVAAAPKEEQAGMQQTRVIDAPREPVMDIPTAPRLDSPKAAAIDIPKMPVFAAQKKSVVVVPKKKELNTDMQRVWILDAPRKPVMDVPVMPKLDIPKAAVIDIPKMPVFAAQKKSAVVVPKKKESTAANQKLPRPAQKVTVMIPRGNTIVTAKKPVLSIHSMPKRKES